MIIQLNSPLVQKISEEDDHVLLAQFDDSHHQNNFLRRLTLRKRLKKRIEWESFEQAGTAVGFSAKLEPLLAHLPDLNTTTQWLDWDQSGIGTRKPPKYTLPDLKTTASVYLSVYSLLLGL